MNLPTIRASLQNNNIRVTALREHNKASEKYVDVIFTYPSKNLTVPVSVPFQYRRTGLLIENAPDLVAYLEKVYEIFSGDLRIWIEQERNYWSTYCESKTVTKPFFDKLLNLKWNCVGCELPSNPNWARRIQDIKEMGYTLATDTSRNCQSCRKNTTHILLLPFEKGRPTGYEMIDPSLKRRIVPVLGAVNIYENRTVSALNALISDHKFPEIRWDAATREENPGSMTDAEIRDKFQLLDNQRNLQKREACRNCFQTGRRGTLFGINFFYSGTENWPVEIPRTGREAERGCCGCGWYDIKKWRDALNRKAGS